MKSLGFILSILLALPVWADIELRVHSGYNTFSSEEFKTYLDTSPNSLDPLRDITSTGGDLMYVFEESFFVTGIRFTSYNTSEDFTGGYNSTQGTYTESLRLDLYQLLLGYRFANETLYFGFITAVGVNASGSLAIKQDGSVIDEWSSQSATNYDAGIEFGIRKKTFTAGTEFGYSATQLTQLTDESEAVLQNVDGEDLTLDLTGFYAKFIFGLRF